MYIYIYNYIYIYIYIYILKHLRSNSAVKSYVQNTFEFTFTASAVELLTSRYYYYSIYTAPKTMTTPLGAVVGNVLVFFSIAFGKE